MPCWRGVACFFLLLVLVAGRLHRRSVESDGVKDHVSKLNELWTKECAERPDSCEEGFVGWRPKITGSKFVDLDDCALDPGVGEEDLNSFIITYSPTDVNLADVCHAPCEYKSLGDGLYTWILARKDVKGPLAFSFAKATNVWEFGSKHIQLSQSEHSEEYDSMKLSQLELLVVGGAYVLVGGEAKIEKDTFTWNLLSGTYTLQNIKEGHYTEEAIEAIAAELFALWVPKDVTRNFQKDELLPFIEEASLDDWIALCDSKEELWKARRDAMRPAGFEHDKGARRVCPAVSLKDLAIKETQLKMVLCTKPSNPTSKQISFVVQRPKQPFWFDSNPELNFYGITLLVLTYDIKSKDASATLGNKFRINLKDSSVTLTFGTTCYKRLFAADGPAECLLISSDSPRALQQRVPKIRRFVHLEYRWKTVNSILLRMLPREASHLKEYLGFLNKPFK